MENGATFSECGKYRYVLWRVWDKNDPAAMVVGLNPSTADSTDDDPTIRNLCSLLKASGFGGLYMTNLFGLISSDPNDLRSCPNPVKDNDKFLFETSLKCKRIFFAWGSFKQAEYRGKKVAAMFPDAYCFGKTVSGKPIHPLAITVWMKAKFEIQKY